ncbi:MAG: efflux RND transporter periplasmic adaptor subunit [Isosphaeraceae bacterium]
MVALGGLAVVMVFLTAANLQRDPGSVELDWQLIKPPAREVVLEPPGRGLIVETITAPGKVESVHEAEIASQLVGRVVAVNVKEGDVVGKGDVLVKIDPTEARARLDSALARIERLRSAIGQSRNELEKASRDARQADKLANRGFNSPTELADAKTAVNKAQAVLKMSQHELVESEALRKTSEQELERTEIRSPIDGVVAGLNVDVGEVVIAGTTNLPGALLMTVSDLDLMRVRADVDETDVPLVRPGQPARIFLQADPLHPVDGKVDRIAPRGKTKAEVVSFETLIKVGEGKHPELRPGMSATVEVEVRRASDALGVPAQAVVHRRRKDLPDTPSVRSWAARNARSPGEKAKEAELRYVKIVFVEERGIARARPVETGLSDERRVEILSGLQPEEKVIVAPFRALDELKDGNAVTRLKASAEGQEKSR